MQVSADFSALLSSFLWNPDGSLNVDMAPKQFTDQFKGSRNYHNNLGSLRKFIIERPNLQYYGKICALMRHIRLELETPETHQEIPLGIQVKRRGDQAPAITADRMPALKCLREPQDQ